MTKSSLLIEMINILRDRSGITVPELSSTLGRSERTVYRWLKEITGSLNMEVCCRDGGYYLVEECQARRVELTPHELLALRMSLRSAPFGDGSPIKTSAESAWLKIRDAAPWESILAANDLTGSHSMHINAPPGEIRPGIADTLERAIDNHRRLRAVYRSQKSNKVKEYTIDPYAIAFRRHAWYVVAYSAEHGKPVQFKLVRFINVSETGETFAPPRDFSVDEFFGLSWEAFAGEELVHVRVRFSPRVAAMIGEVRRHPTQDLHYEPDGGVIFEATVPGIEEIAIWVMGFGREAVALEPESLRGYIADHAKAMAEAYSSGPS